MNRIIAMLILGVLLVAMMLVVANYMSTPGEEDTVSVATGPSGMQEDSTSAEASKIPRELAHLSDTSQTPVVPPAEAPDTVEGDLPQPNPVSSGEQGEGMAQNPTGSVPSSMDLAAADGDAKAAKKKQDAVPMPNTQPVAQTPVHSPATAPKPENASGKAAAGKLTAVGYKFEGNALVFYVQGSTTFEHKVFTLSGPDRLVVDIKGTWGNVDAPTTPSNRLVKSSRVGLHQQYARFVLDLKSPLVKHSATLRDNTLLVTME